MLTLDNYKELITIAQEKDLIYYSPSDISSSEALQDYVKVAIDGYEDKTTIPSIIFDKDK